MGTWVYYLFIHRTAAQYNSLSGYAGGTISHDEAKRLIESDILTYILIVIATPVTYAFSTGGGRLLASLYTRRQLNYLSCFLLDEFGDEHANNLLYHSRQMSGIPNLLSHDIADLNTEIFNLLFGHVYYFGIISKI